MKKLDRLIQIAGLLIVVAIPFCSFCVSMKTDITAQAGEIRTVKATESDHYQELKGDLNKQEARGQRMEDKIDWIVRRLR